MVFIKENPQTHAHHPHLTEKNSWKGVVTDLIRARQTQPNQSLTWRSFCHFSFFFSKPENHRSYSIGFSTMNFMKKTQKKPNETSAQRKTPAEGGEGGGGGGIQHDGWVLLTILLLPLPPPHPPQSIVTAAASSSSSFLSLFELDLKAFLRRWFTKRRQQEEEKEALISHNFSRLSQSVICLATHTRLPRRKTPVSAQAEKRKKGLKKCEKSTLHARCTAIGVQYTWTNGMAALLCLDRGVGTRTWKSGAFFN